ncbi:MAG: YHS domain-containing protein [Sedimentisphaerales bacterium]|jgi:YHS domain-containing protein
MKSPSMKIWAMLGVVVVLSVGLLVLNGCKKSEPAPSGTSSDTTMQMEGHDHAAMAKEAADTETASTTEQTICPVMGNPINKDVFVEYKGKKVYFCCPDCVEKFKADPEKYVAKLPQFKQ